MAEAGREASANVGSLKRTKNAALQFALDAWVVEGARILSLAHHSTERANAILAFARTFVPLHDIAEEDVIHFADSLTNDDEFYASLVRELQQCASGQSVEKIGGDEKARAVFTLLPPEGTLSEGSSLDIVREVAFVNVKGSGWRAEG